MSQLFARAPEGALRPSGQRIVVVGASLAGLRLVEALRRHGYADDLVWLGDEPHLPYDRPPLSKEILRGTWLPERVQLRKEGYEALRLDVRLGARASGLDLAAGEVIVGERREQRIAFDKLAITTGARARRLPGHEGLANVHVLRTLDDALALRSALEKRPRVCVVGAGFIGAEVASSARALGLEVTLVEAQREPLAQLLGAHMASLCVDLHRRNGVSVRLGVAVERLEGAGQVSGVRLADGELVPAELVVAGIGVLPNTEWLGGAGVQVDDGVVCDATCRVLADDGQPLSHVVAAGDVARFFNPLYGESMRIEHWTHAVEQADHAAATLLGDAKPWAPAPVFWSDQYGLKLQLAGRPKPDDHVEVCHGSVAEGRFVALYGRAGTLVAALAFGRPAQLVKYRRLVEQRTSFAETVRQARA